MKKNILFAIVLSAAALVSCNRGTENTWDGNYQERMAEYLERADKILKGETDGWHMIYYAGDAAGNMAGAMNYHMKFADGEKVTITADFDTGSFPAGTSSETTYRLKSDAGAVLSFDTYNEMIHYFTEYKGSSTTYRGDFEFIFHELTEEMIILYGKRYDQYIVMKPWSNGDPGQYLADLNNFINASAYPNYKMLIDGGGDAGATFNIDTRKLTMDGPDGKRYYSLLFDLEGFYLSRKADNNVMTTIANPITYFKWDAATETFTGQVEGKEYKLERTIPEGYIPYDDYLGTYTFSYRETTTGTVYSKTITLSEGVKNKTLRVSQNAVGYDFHINYLWNNSGKLGITPQFLEEHTVNGVAYHLWLLPYDSVNGYMNYTLSIGLNSKTLNTSPLSFTFIDNGVWGSYKADGIYLRYLDVTNTSYEGFLPSAYRYVLMNFVKQ